MVSNMSYFQPYLGKGSNLTSIFSDVWFNHQLVFQPSMIVGKKHIPGASKWPFDSLVGGHLTFPNGHLTIPKRAQRIARFFCLHPSSLKQPSFCQKKKTSFLLANQALWFLGGWIWWPLSRGGDLETMSSIVRILVTFRNGLFKGDTKGG